MGVSKAGVYPVMGIEAALALLLGRFITWWFGGLEN
jgi:hypothetical protein